MEVQVFVMYQLARTRFLSIRFFVTVSTAIFQHVRRLLQLDSKCVLVYRYSWFKYLETGVFFSTSGPPPRTMADAGAALQKCLAYA